MAAGDGKTPDALGETVTVEAIVGAAAVMAAKAGKAGKAVDSVDVVDAVGAVGGPGGVDVVSRRYFQVPATSLSVTGHMKRNQCVSLIMGS